MFFLFFLVLGQSNKLVGYWSGPYWANKVVNAKISYIKEVPRFDIIFFGSSRTYRHIIPRVIDSILNVSSFNLAGGGTSNPEAWYIVDHLIQDISTEKKPKYLIIELQGIQAIASKNEASARSKYFLDFEPMVYATKHFLERGDYGNAKTYFTSFLNKNLFLGIVKEQAKTAWEMNRYYRKTCDDISQSAGYRSLESNVTKGHLKRRSDLLANPDSLVLRKIKILNEYETPDYTPSSYEVALIEDIILSCKSNEIMPIFIKPPRAYQLLELHKNLDKADKIDMGNPATYSEFYSIENSYDLGHMNNKGSELYSIELAKKLAELID